MLNWIKYIWYDYVKFKLKKDSMLFLDDATSHNTPEVRKKISELGSEVIKIPSGCTCRLQPVDVVINKPLKDAIKKKYVEYCLNNELNAKVSRN